MNQLLNLTAMMNTAHRPIDSTGTVLTLTDPHSPFASTIDAAIDSLQLRRHRVEDLDQLLLQLSALDRNREDRCLVIASERFLSSAMEQIVHLQLQRIYLPMVVMGTLPDEVDLPFRHVLVMDIGSSVPDVSQAIETTLQMSHQYNRLIGQVALFETLNEREMEIVRLASTGMPNKSIARRMEISIKTVEKYRRNAYQKLQVASSAEMAALFTFSQFVAGK